MELVMQPEGSSLCGQACVAMVAGVSLEQSITAFSGKQGKTRTRDLLHALAALNIRCNIRLNRVSKGIKLPATCILLLRWKDKQGKLHGHWIVWHQELYYDPEIGIIEEYPDWWGKFTSFMEVSI